MPTLYLMLGYPGAGKTTAAKLIHQLTGATHLWTDKIRNERYPQPTHAHDENMALYKYLNELTAELLASGQDVIFDTAFNEYKDRQLLRQVAQDHHADVKLVWVQLDRRLAEERAVHPEHATQNTYPYSMTPEQFKRLADKLEVPHADESYVTIDGSRIGLPYVKQQLGL